MQSQEHTVIKAGVSVIVINSNKLLVGLRKGSHGNGLWAFPGGHIDSQDRSLKECGEREVFEETGIICNVFSPDHYRQDLFTTFDILSEDGSKRYVTSYLVANYLLGGTHEVANGETGVVPLEPKKCEKWRWKTLEELARMVTSDRQKVWIPIHQVLHYIRKFL